MTVISMLEFIERMQNKDEERKKLTKESSSSARDRHPTVASADERTAR
jgi:hypothetical protein